MGIKVICDKCGHQEEIRTLPQGWPVNMHSVSPDNSAGNDRILCDACYQAYRQLEKDVTKKLLDWLDNRN